MRILAVDPGTRRVGLALSDPTETIASPLGTEPAEPAESLAERLAKAAAEHEVGRIVVGLPRELSGKRGPAAVAAERLAAELRKASGLPVHMPDERLTSAGRDRLRVDAGMARDKRRKAGGPVAAALR